MPSPVLPAGNADTKAEVAASTLQTQERELHAKKPFGSLALAPSGRRRGKINP